MAPRIALRNTLGLAVPLALGVAAGFPGAGLVAATGALNVSFSDGDDAYRSRARRLLAASALVGAGVLLGAISGQHRPVAAALSVAWAFGAAMLIALGTAAADLAGVSLVTFIVFTSLAMPPAKALSSGLIAIAGGLFQSALALALWPIRPYRPQRLILGELYRKLAEMAATTSSASEPPPLTAELTKAQDAMAALARDHSVQSERYLSLLNQAERIRLSVLAISRMRIRLERAAFDARALERALRISSELLASMADWLAGNEPALAPERLQEIAAIAEQLRRENIPSDVCFQVNALAGQIRAAADLAFNATPQGEAAFARRESRRSWRLRLAGTLATLRAHLTFQSTAFRHALRLAACIAVSEIVSGVLGFQRSYWMPMTIAIVLKPDFTSTFSRGLLRVAGTFAGLLLTTGLFHLYRPGMDAEVALTISAFFAMRCFGPANYGIFVAALSALVVVLIAITGADPKTLIAARAWNTAVGGALALLAYAVWPTWERHQVSEALANMLDAYLRYFQAIADACENPQSLDGAVLDRIRRAARLARSQAEASVDRVYAEPGGDSARAKLLGRMLASSHRWVHAVMALEAGLSAARAGAPEAFRKFRWDIELTLHSLAAALRGSPLASRDLPDLREDHHAMLRSSDRNTESYTVLHIETDRLTNSLNTLTGQVIHWTGSAASQPENALQL